MSGEQAHGRLQPGFQEEARGERLSGHHGRQPSPGLSGVFSRGLDIGASSGAILPKRPDAGIQVLWAKRSILVIFGVTEGTSKESLPSAI